LNSLSTKAYPSNTESLANKEIHREPTSIKNAYSHHIEISLKGQETNKVKKKKTTRRKETISSSSSQTKIAIENDGIKGK